MVSALLWGQLMPNLNSSPLPFFATCRSSTSVKNDSTLEQRRFHRRATHSALLSRTQQQSV